KSTAYFFNAIQGYFGAWMTNQPKLLTREQGKFLRNYRWRKIAQKIFN
ncbi:MAG: glycosyl transferase family 2, partial [Bacteroidetes bacterium HGW-Bacteroidetes-13]